MKVEEGTQRNCEIYEICENYGKRDVQTSFCPLPFFFALIHLGSGTGQISMLPSPLGLICPLKANYLSGDCFPLFSHRKNWIYVTCNERKTIEELRKITVDLKPPHWSAQSKPAFAREKFNTSSKRFEYTIRSIRYEDNLNRAVCFLERIFMSWNNL